MVHYVCSERCGSTSKTPGNCQTKSCTKYGKPLKPCNCTDGKHSVPLTEDSDEEQEEANDSTK